MSERPRHSCVPPGEGEIHQGDAWVCPECQRAWVLVYVPAFKGVMWAPSED